MLLAYENKKARSPALLFCKYAVPEALAEQWKHRGLMLLTEQCSSRSGGRGLFTAMALLRESPEGLQERVIRC